MTDMPEFNTPDTHLAVIDQRLNGIEKTMADMARAMDQLADNRERQILTEAHVDQLNHRVDALHEENKDLRDKLGDVRSHVSAMMARYATLNSVAMILIPFAISVGVSYFK